jgi:hypothetical protein
MRYRDGLPACRNTTEQISSQEQPGGGIECYVDDVAVVGVVVVMIGRCV